MSVVEFIGFVISLIAFIFLMFRRVFEEWKRPEIPGGAEEASKNSYRLEDFLRSLEVDMEESKKISPPQKKLKESRPKPLPLPRHEIRGDFLKNVQESAEKIEEEKQRLENQFSGKGVVSSRYKNSAKPYETEISVTPSRVQTLLKKLPSKQEMVLLYEIFDRPKGFRQ